MKHVAVAILLLISAASANSVRLPPDELGLAALLEEEAIDSAQYEQLLVCYALPLSVPHGELDMLAEIFPELAGMLPAAGRLAEYRPFDNRRIQRLYSDYPALADFEPILRFNEQAQKVGSNGEVIFGINRSPVSALLGHRVRFRASTPGGKGKGSRVQLSAEGNLALTDSSAMWQGRRLGLSYRGVKAQIGNFKQPLPGELIYGRFSALTANERSDAAANWQSGGISGWNGVAVDVKGIPGAPMLSASAFYHNRPMESAAGGGTEWRVNRQAKIYLGMTEFTFADDANATDADGAGGANRRIYTAHLYGEYRGKTWQASAETGLPLGEDGIIPALALRLSYRIKESSAQYRLISYPHDFTAPASRAKRQILTESGEKMPTALPQPPQSPAVQKHILKMTVPLAISLADTMKLIPDIEFTESEGSVKRIQARAEARARISAANISVKHASKIFTMGADSALHTSSASLSVETGYRTEVRAFAQSIYGYYKDARNSYTLELVITAAPDAVVTPFIRGKYVSEHERWYGIKTEIHLYKKTWTSVLLEMPVNVKGAEGVYIKGSSSYSF